MASMALLLTEQSTYVHEPRSFGPCRVMSGLLHVSVMPHLNEKAFVTE